MVFSYYIYYRVQPEQAAACERAVRAVLSAVHAATGIAGRLMKKRGETNLWMEVYEGVTDDAKFEWELSDAAGRRECRRSCCPGPAGTSSASRSDRDSASPCSAPSTGVTLSA